MIQKEKVLPMFAVLVYSVMTGILDGKVLILWQISMIELFEEVILFLIMEIIFGTLKIRDSNLFLRE